MFMALLCLLPLTLQDATPKDARWRGPEGRLLVLEKNAAKALLIDTATGQAITSWPVGDGPHEVALSPNGKWAVVSNYGGEEPGSSLSVIDLLKVGPPAPPHTIELDAAVRPHGLVFTADSRFVWVTAEIPGSLWRVEIATGKVMAKVPVGGGLGHMVARLDDGHLFVSHIGAGAVTPVVATDIGGSTATAPAGWRGMARIPTGAGAEGLAIRPGRGQAQLWVGNRAEDSLSLIDPQSLKVVQTLPCPGFPIRVGFSADGALAAVSCAEADELALYDAAEGELLGRIALGDGATPIGLCVNAAGSHLYVSCSGRNEIAEVDLRLRRVTRRFATGEVPDGIAWLPPLPAQTSTGPSR